MQSSWPRFHIDQTKYIIYKYKPPSGNEFTRMTARLSLVTTSPFPNVSALILKHSDPSILFLPPFFWRQQFFWQPKIGTTIANHFFSKQMFVVESHQQHPFVAMLVLLFMDCICRTFRRVTGVIEVLQGCQKPTENLPGQTEGFDDSICI